jgi:four helix bundle protein
MIRLRRGYDGQVVDFGFLIWKTMTPQELEDRLIDFAVMVIDVVESLPNTKAGNHVGGQLIRSGTSPAPNYAEARSAESRKDFVHKMKISLKELRETMVWLKIIARKRLGDCRDIPASLGECAELIAIFTSSTKTADGGK